MRIFLILFIIAALGWVLDRIALYLERKGLLYYRNQKPEKGILGSALLELNAQLLPTNRHVVVAKQEKAEHRKIEDDADKDKSMLISFKKLSEADLDLLLNWLERPHVKAWWDTDVQWTPDLIRDKFASYIQGYKIENGIKKSMLACIIYVAETPIGYIQLYNAHDFSRTVPLEKLPQSLAAFDIFIGEEEFTNKGIGSKIIVQFLDTYANSYTHVFVDPELKNPAAIRAYEKAGFKVIDYQPVDTEVWMIRNHY